MKKRFKHIYIEITNKCNLSCSFCSPVTRKLEYISVSSFEEIIRKVEPYTSTVYLHVKGEPLTHPNLEELLLITKRYNLWVNITTNGTLLKDKGTLFNKFPNVKKFNISLHSENNNSNYLEDIFKFVKSLKITPTIVYRFWTEFPQEYVDCLKLEYNLSTDIVDKIYNCKNTKISLNTFVDKDEEFVWPSIENNYYNEVGFCYALKSHIAILVDGTVVPCCLDSDGFIKLGNIFEDDLDAILNNDKITSIILGFRNRKVIEELCKHCSFKNKF